MVLLTSVALFSCLAGVAWAQTAATDAPARYQGLYRKPEGGVETLNCGPNSIFATSSTYAGCCSIGGNCNFPTACATGTATNRLGGTFTCDQGQQCYTMTVVDNSASPTQSVLVHNCAKEWAATTIYRELGPVTTSTSSPASSETSTASPGGSAISTSSTPSPNPAQNDGSKSEPEESSKPNAGMIAGITVGGVLVVLLVGFLGFWFGRRDGRGSVRGGASHHHSEEGTGSGGPVQLALGASSSSWAPHGRTATNVSGIGSIPGVPTDPWYGFNFPAPPKSPGWRGYPESPYDKFIGVQVNEMEGDGVSVRGAARPGTGGGEKKFFAGGSFFDDEPEGIELAAGPTPPAAVYRDSSMGRKIVRMGHAELEGEGLGALVRKKSMI